MGHSYGANCAMGGATLTGNVHHLVLYEPSMGVPYPSGSIERIEAALARGDHDAAIVAVLVDILEITDEEIDGFAREPAVARAPRRRPDHPARVPRRGRLGLRPGQFDAVTAETLFLAGSDSVPVVTQATERAAAAIPDAQIRVLQGHGHFAHKTDPTMVTAIIKRFIAGSA